MLKKGLLIIGIVFAWSFVEAQDQENYAPEKISSSYNSRIALVIGNSQYEGIPLRNPSNDARVITTELELAGFEVISYTDLDKRGMRSAIREFGEKIAESKGVGLFYYAGHGIQSNGVNYLVPTDADIKFDYEIEDMCMRADQVLRMLEIYENPLNIVIIDACRNNPFGSKFRSMGEGLAMPETAPVGTIVAFSTSPGKTASDGDGENGLYTQELIKAIRTPGLAIEQMFKKVRISVLRESNRQQSPWENSSLTGDFYFYPPVSNAKVAVVDESETNSFYEFESISFFESDYEAEGKTFGTSFLKTNTRYINAQINFKNKKHKQEDWITNFKIKFYKPNGILWTDLAPEKLVSSEYEDASAYSGWGWSNPGYWSRGTYRVEVWDGKNQVGEAEFSIEGETSDFYQLTAIDFFETQETENKNYTQEFDVYESKYIATNLKMENIQYGKTDWVSSFFIRYLRPDGELFGEITINNRVSKEDKSLDLWKSYGYANIGYWDTGVYTVEIWDGDDKIGEREFEMKDNRKSYESNYKIQSISFFESDENGELSDRMEEFDLDSTRYINTYIQFVNFQHKKQSWDTNFEVKYYKPDGSLWADLEKKVPVSSELDYAYVTLLWGWNNFGYWTPGVYRVEVWDGKNLIGETSFKVNDSPSNYVFQNVKFFEAGTDYDEKVFDTLFSAEQSRYIYTELDLRNLKYDKEQWNTNFHIKYFYPSGELFGEFDLINEIGITLNFFNVRDGYGWEDPGNWTLGTYKVEVWDGEVMLAESEFTVN